jgi:hypothetical protein
VYERLQPYRSTRFASNPARIGPALAKFRVFQGLERLELSSECRSPTNRSKLCYSVVWVSGYRILVTLVSVWARNYMSGATLGGPGAKRNYFYVVPSSITWSHVVNWAQYSVWDIRALSCIFCNRFRRNLILVPKFEKTLEYLQWCYRYVFLKCEGNWEYVFGILVYLTNWKYRGPHPIEAPPPIEAPLSPPLRNRSPGASNGGFTVFIILCNAFLVVIMKYFFLLRTEPERLFCDCSRRLFKNATVQAIVQECHGTGDSSRIPKKFPCGATVWSRSSLEFAAGPGWPAGRSGSGRVGSGRRVLTHKWPADPHWPAGQRGSTFEILGHSNVNSKWTILCGLQLNMLKIFCLRGRRQSPRPWICA